MERPTPPQLRVESKGLKMPFGNIFSFKRTPPSTTDETNYQELYENLKTEFQALDAKMMTVQNYCHEVEEENLKLKQANDQLDQQNSALGNGLLEIINQQTGKPNATVKRMVGIAKKVLGLVD